MPFLASCVELQEVPHHLPDIQGERIDSITPAPEFEIEEKKNPSHPNRSSRSYALVMEIETITKKQQELRPHPHPQYQYPSFLTTHDRERRARTARSLAS
jgi:hypothetical protein